MAQQITKNHLAFMKEARKAFEESNLLETYCNKEEFDLIALRYGMDRNCIQVYEIGEDIANFVQQMEPAPKPRKPLMQFAFDMEKQLRVNDHKKGWGSEHYEFLMKELTKNYTHLIQELQKLDRDKHEITIRSANIANFAMMIADNEGQNL
ncbi:hypothetical protein [Fictibacillus nanhaiensis]|uniref:hypothetical protein n=1 Tax=Fictibacillus nanhaiensis TaxID=742169 RepID=UPI003C239411